MRIGVEPATVGRWERGLHKPLAFHHQKLCELFGKTKQELGLSKQDETVPSLEGQARLPLHLAISEPVVVEDSSVAFRTTDLTESLESLVWSWLVRKAANAHYHELQVAITLELKRKDNRKMNEDSLSRRDALRRLASLPIRVCCLSVIGPVMIRPLEEILAHCAAGLTACWHLRQGKDLTFVFDTLSWYLPTLRELVKVSSSEKLRKEAADLLAQCLSLQSALAKHVTTISDSIHYAVEAAKYGEASANPLLHVRTLGTQASIFSYANQWTQAFHAARQAKYVMDQALAKDATSIPPLAQSFVYAHLASCQAYEGQRQEALRSLGKAHTTFFAQSINEAVPVYLNHTQANLILKDGLAHYHLGIHDKAFDSFGQIIELPSRAEEIGIEALINQALVEASREDKEPNMEQCITLWTQGIEGAKILGSQQRFNEAIIAYATMCGTWRKEKAIKDLRSLTVWPEQHDKHN